MGWPTTDKEMLKAMEPFIEEVYGFPLVVVGTSSVEMPADRPIVRTQEAALGNFLADAFRYFMDNERKELVEAFGSIDFVLVNSGSIRAPFPAGDITNEIIST